MISNIVRLCLKHRHTFSFVQYGYDDLDVWVINDLNKMGRSRSIRGCIRRIAGICMIGRIVST